MKKLLSFLVALFAVAVASAQVENSIILDSSTFRAVQRDALTGVNIDPIAKDMSRNACARVKIRFANMSRTEIEALGVKFRSNTDLAKRKVAEYFDNVLILEMTAKSNTRFFVVSPEFGESNEVTLNLEGNKEYEIDARLNQTYSIAVNSNVEGAEVYIDNIYKGRTGANLSLTVSEVMIGSHTLKVVYGGISQEQQIEVNKSSIQFRQTVNTSASKPQFVVFVVEPSNAVVTIDNKHYALQDGAMQVLLENGSYNYTVSAVGYHSQSGNFTVSGSKVEKSISLTADSATVTITAPNGAEIWINGVKKGVGSWSGTLNSGTYIFEARKAGHQTTSISKNITSAVANQSYTLPAPIPIVGSLVVSGAPIMADVELDGKNVGRMPLDLAGVLEGSHTLKVSKAGYADYTQTVVISENKVTTVNVALTKQSIPVAVTSSTVGKIYKVGDYYNENGKEGVVFEVSADGCSGKIVSLVQTTSMVKWTNDSYEERRTIGADDTVDGSVNMAKAMSITNWQIKFPAFKWCADLGEGWYLPALQELKTISSNKSLIEGKLNKPLGENFYFSSTEMNTKDNGIACVHDVSMKSGNYLSTRKDYHSYAIAVAKFGKSSSGAATNSPNGRYKVGDLYTANGVKGVVFEVDASGNHGKIVSVACSGYDQAWAVGSEQARFIGAVDENNGANNLAVVKRINNWQTKYPAFYWCARLGEGWYLPANNELKAIFANKDKIEPKLLHKLNVYLWSSTEVKEMYQGQYCSWNANTTGGMATYCKGRENVVFAVYKF